jgi:ABC-type branched-subunit amino acid transport system ATPase component
MVLAMKPIIMLLDEPTAGMNQERQNTVRLIREISRKGILRWC